MKRRTHQHTVVLSDDENNDVRWKETLYLNLLVQLHCELTVAVCTKVMLPDGRSTMHAERHVTKRVYASPSKTRMDKKGNPQALLRHSCRDAMGAKAGEDGPASLRAR